MVQVTFGRIAIEVSSMIGQATRGKVSATWSELSLATFRRDSRVVCQTWLIFQAALLMEMNMSR